MNPILSQLLAGGQVAVSESNATLSDQRAATEPGQFTVGQLEGHDLTKAGFAQVLGLLVNGPLGDSAVDVGSFQQVIGDIEGEIGTQDLDHVALEGPAESVSGDEQATIVVPVTISLVSTTTPLSEVTQTSTDLDRHSAPNTSKSGSPFIGTNLVVNDTSGTFVAEHSESQAIDVAVDQSSSSSDETSPSGKVSQAPDTLKAADGRTLSRQMNQRTDTANHSLETEVSGELINPLETRAVRGEMEGPVPEALPERLIEPTRATLLSTARSSERNELGVRGQSLDAGQSSHVDLKGDATLGPDGAILNEMLLDAESPSNFGDTHRGDRAGPETTFFSVTPDSPQRVGDVLPHDVGPSHIPIEVTSFPAGRTPQTVSQVDVASQIFESVRIASEADGEVPTRVEVELDPPELGRMSVELTDSSRGVVARLAASSEMTAALIESQLAHLKQTLEQAGVQVHEFHVTPDFNASQSQDFHRQTPKGRLDTRRGSRLGRVAQATNDLPAAPLRRLPTGRIDLRI